MTVYVVTAPNGKEYEVTAPEGATQEQVLAYARTSFEREAPAQRAAGIVNADAEYSPTGAFMENALAGAGKSLVDLYRGGADLVTDIIPGESQYARNLDTDIADSTRRDQALMRTGGGIVGNIAGTTAAMLPAGAAGATLKGGAALGGLLGMLDPTTEDESRAMNTATGAGLGLLGSAAGKGLSRIIQPRPSAGISRIAERGDIAMTPGQRMGEFANRMEQKLISVPVLGDAIRSARRSTIEQWNKSIGRQVLANVDEALPQTIKPGEEMITYMGNRLSDKYDDLMPSLAMKVDDTFKQEIQSLNQLAANMSDDAFQQYKRIMKRSLFSKLSKVGGMQGQTLKEAESSLTKEIGDFARSTHPNDRKIYDALKEARSILRDNVARNNPQAADELTKLNRAWAELAIVEDAASRVGAGESIFSPTHLRSAARMADKSVRHRRFARGESLFKQEAQDAVNVLGETVPNSGTTDRLLAGLLTAGTAGAIEPIALGGLLGASGLYGTTAGRKVLQGLLTTNRPAIAKQLANVPMYLGAPAATSYGLINNGQ